MSPLRFLSIVGLIGSTLVPLAACSDSVALPDDGALVISVIGFPPGIRGLSVLIGSESHAFVGYEPRPRVFVGGLAPGDHTLELVGLPTDVPASCTVPAGNEQVAAVGAGVSRPVDFFVHCAVGTLRVNTSTTGADLDLDGYSLRVTRLCTSYDYDYNEFSLACGEMEIPVPSNGTVVGTMAESLIPGQVDATLEGIASNCTPPPPQTFDYPALSTITFTVTCR